MPILYPKAEMQSRLKINTGDFPPPILLFSAALGVAGDALLNQFAWVNQMFRPEMAAGPAAIVLELYAEKIPDFAEDTITNRP